MKTIKLTKTTVEKLPFPEKGRVFCSDLELPGFGLRVGAKTIRKEMSLRRLSFPAPNV